jgi:hypothetical protein
MQTALPPDPPRAGATSARGVAMPLLAAVLVMLTFVIIPPAPWDLNVDADTSSSAVLNYAHQQGLQFGADIVYLYGPLGYLTYFYFSPHAAGMRMAVDTVLCFTVAAGVCLLAWRLRFVSRCLLLGIFMFLAANVEARTDLVIDTGILCWGLLCFVESGRRLAVAVLAFAALAAFGSLAKTLVLLIAGLSVVLLAGDLVARGHRRLGVGIVAGFGAGVVLGWLASGQNLWGIGPCLLNALAVVQGYSQSLGWEALPQATRSGLLVMLAAMAMVLIRAWTAFAGQDKRNAWRRGLLLAWVSALLFLTWKHGFARGDSYHLVYFFGFVPLLGLALEVLPGGGRAARLWARGLGAACCLLSIVTLQSLFFPPGWKSLGQPFRAFGYHARCLLRPADYRQRMNALIEAKRGEAQLPRFRNIIGRASVDVFGQYAVYALLNDLNYRPRPVFQSYVACNTRLMRLNEEFYLSKAAPEFVMFGLGPIDRKFPPLEDAMVLRDLLINYEPVAAEGGFLLLKSKSADAPRLTLLREGTVRPGEQIDLREFGDAELWLELDLEPTLSGRLRQFFYRPPTVRLAAWREPAKGLLFRRRAPAAMLAAGFVASPLLLRNEDVLSLYDGNPIPRPAAYSVELLAGEDHFWQPGIRFRVYRIENQLGRPARATLDWPGAS